MQLSINEIKIQAKKLLQAKKTETNSFSKFDRYFAQQNLSPQQTWQLKHCLQAIAKDLGFSSWQEAQQLFSGDKKIDSSTNFGTFFYPKQCFAFINEWFSDYQEAVKGLMISTSKKWLLPYKSQFLLVEEEYIAALGLNIHADNFALPEGRNLLATYHSATWDRIVSNVIRARAS